MITYAAINLTNKKFYVGSTVDFKERCKKHHRNKGDLAFHRSLRKDPENFYWIVSEDDGLNTRDEEQYYLDFYHGTMWCYNLNPLASCPPNLTGRTGQWSEESRKNRSGGGNPAFGKKPWNFELPREDNPMTGVKCPRRGRKGEENYAIGKSWFNNGTEQKRCYESPGSEWSKGMLPRGAK